MNLKKAASAAMAAVMTMSATAPTVLAAEEASSPAVNAGQESSEDAPSGPPVKAYTKEQNHQSTKVYAAVNGMYVLTVPESINLHNADKSDIGSGLYVNDKHCKVNLKGDIGYEKVVSVTVTNPVMQSKGAADKTATVDTTTKTVWNRNDLLAGATEDASGEFSDPVGTSVVYPVSAELTPGDWVGTATFNCTMGEAPNIASLITGIQPTSFDYDGQEHSPEPIFTNGVNLVEGRDYTISGDAAKTDEGKYTIHINASGEYAGDVSYNWEIKRYDINDAVSGLDKDKLENDGTTKKPNIQWNPGFENLVKDKDYTITGTPLASSDGNYTITITGIGKYKGEITLPWQIFTPTDISLAVDGITPNSFDFDGNKHTPEILWKDEFKDLVNGKDYEITGDTEKSAEGEYTITVTGKGDYKGTVSFTWNIIRHNISAAIKGIDPKSYDYDGQEHTPGIVWNTGFENLVPGVDYEIVGDTNKSEEGKYTLTINGVGKYKGTTSFPWEIKRYDISGAVSGLDKDRFENDGSTKTPNIQWNEGFENLVKDKDYTITGTPSASGDGNYTITITGIGKYKGEITLDWKIITRNEISLAAQGLTPEFYDYDGKSHTPGIVWNTGFENLKENVDYTISGDMNQTEEGVYTLTVTGIGNYKGTVSFQWEIKKYDIAIAVKGLNKTRYKSNFLIHRPNVTWNDGYNLSKGTDYKISGTTYALAAGNYKITVTGMGKYKGSVDLPWTIAKVQNISNAIAGIDPTAFDYDGKSHTPSIIWKDGFKNLIEGVDYTVTGDKDKTEIGKYTLTVNGLETFNGSKDFSWEIKGKDISTVIASISPEHFDYDGQEHSPAITWNAGFENLVPGVDYEISGDTTKSACGDYTLTVTGIGKYGGGIQFNWNIRELIPVNAVYTISNTGEKLIGDGKSVYFPLHAYENDTYVDEDYTYACKASNGWSVHATDNTKTSYGPIRSYICDGNITNLYGTFEGCSNMTEAPVIPDSVTSMWNTFCKCTSLVEASAIPAGVTDMTNTFWGCTSLVEAPAIPAGVTNMTNTFWGCTSLVEAPAIPAGVTNMSGTFFRCTALTVAPSIPEKVTSLSQTFMECTSLKTYVGSTDADGDFSNYKLPSGLLYMNGVFRECKMITSAPTIPDGVKYVNDAFRDCEMLLVAPAIPDSVISMSCTFWGCLSMTEAPIIPDNAKDIQNVFYDCQALKSYAGSTDPDGDFSNYKIPDIASIRYVFSGCRQLSVVPVIPNGVTDMEGTFERCASIAKAPIIPKGVTSMCVTFYGCTSLKTYIGSTDPDGDFSNYKIPSSVTDMRGTFEYCDKLTVATVIPDNVTDMGYTFLKCTSLVEAPVIPNSVTNMGQTFLGCTSLKSYAGSTDSDGDFSGYNIPDSVTNIGGAFASCNSLAKAPIIPANVDKMYCRYGTFADGAFEGCTNLTGTLICNANPTIYDKALKGTQITAIEGSCTEETKQALLATKTDSAQ